VSFWWRLAEWLGFERPDSPTAPRFEIDAGSIPAQVFGLESYQTTTGPAPKVPRREAIQVPAVKRGRDLIAGEVGGIPFRLVDTENVEHVSSLLTQPERNRARSITMTRLVEDLLFEGIAYWWTRERDYRNYPAYVWRVDPGSQVDAEGYLHVNMPNGNEVKVPPRDYIQFDSPTDGILDAGARAIRTYLKLSAAADRYADSPLPQGYFTPMPEADPDEADIPEFLDDWTKARQTRADAYVPGALDYKTLQWDPEKLQLDAARSAAVVEIGRVLGIDPEDLGVSTTSRTYQNSQDRRISKINESIGMYVSAIQERLSMPDVTPRGYRILADFNGFLRADDLSRFKVYQLGIAMGIYDRNAVAEREGLPRPMFAMPRPALPAGQDQESSNDVAAEAPSSRNNFDAGSLLIGFETPESRNIFAVDQAARTITGLAVPYGVTARRNGRTYQFSQGSLTWAEPSRVKLLIQHDRSQAVGRGVTFEDGPDGLRVTFKIARTPEGDRALVLAEDGVYDGLSIGLLDDAQFSERSGVWHSGQGNILAEVSLTPSPAFDSARVSAVVAEADNQGEIMEPCAVCGHVHTAGQAACTPAPQFDMGQFAQAFQAYLAANPAAPAGAQGPEVINPAEGATGAPGVTLEVNEPEPYRFDRGVLMAGTHDFASDLRAASQHDAAATQRAMSFIQEHIFTAPITSAPDGPVRTDAGAGEGFAVIPVANVAALNPNVQRPDLYVTQREFVFPLWEAIRKETLEEITPMVVPKWSAHSSLVAAHTEDVEPAEGQFTATSETITPGAVSGKVRISRELWDQGGPMASALIWQKMVYEYNKALEAIAWTELEAESPGATITLPTNAGTWPATYTQAQDYPVAAAFEAAIADLQYVATGNSYTSLALQQDLYRLFARATDTSGRKLYPMFGPVNANGTVSPRFARLSIAGLEGYPVTSAAAPSNASSNSYLFDPAAIYAAASAPQRLEFQWQVRSVELAVWGYRVVEVIDNPGIRRVSYDPGT
jgi:HK97 family phage prohead protease